MCLLLWEAYEIKVLIPMGIASIIVFLFAVWINIIKDVFLQSNKRQWIMIVGCVFILTLSLQLLPKIDTGNLFPNKEKKEVEILINLAIDELMQSRIHRISFIKDMKEKKNDKNRKHYLNKNKLIELADFNELMDNKLFFEYCRISHKMLRGCQDNIQKTMEAIDDSTFKVDYRLKLLNFNLRYITFTELFLKETLRFLNEDITDKELERNRDKLDRKYLPTKEERASL